MLSLLCRALVYSKTVLNSTPTKIAHDCSSPFHIPSLAKVKGLYSVFSSFRECLQKVWNVQFQVTDPVPVAGKLTVDSQTKTLVECVCCETTHSWCGSIAKCVHSWHPPACFIPDILLPSIMKQKIHDKEMPPTKRVDEVTSNQASKRAQQSGSGN